MSKPLKKPSEPGGKGNNGEKFPQKFVSAGKTTKQIMQRHLQDKNDIITEEDFINLDIELGIPGDEADPLFTVTEDTIGSKDDEGKDPKIITP
jgi:hypothetical protein